MPAAIALPFLDSKPLTPKSGGTAGAAALAAPVSGKAGSVGQEGAFGQLLRNSNSASVEQAGASGTAQTADGSEAQISPELTPNAFSVQAAFAGALAPDHVAEFAAEIPQAADLELSVTAPLENLANAVETLPESTLPLPVSESLPQPQPVEQAVLDAPALAPVFSAAASCDAQVEASLAEEAESLPAVAALASYAATKNAPVPAVRGQSSSPVQENGQLAGASNPSTEAGRTGLPQGAVLGGVAEAEGVLDPAAEAELARAPALNAVPSSTLQAAKTPTATPLDQAAATASLNAAPRADAGAANMPAELLTQAMAPISSAAPMSSYAALATAAESGPVVTVRPGQTGADVGAEIAKVAKGEGDSVLIRLDPRDMGRIDVRLSFDRDGILRAVMSVDNASAMEILRRESGELNRALADAGVRSDSQSLRFDSRQNDAQSQWANSNSGNGSGNGQGQTSVSGDGSTAGDADATYTPLRTTSQIDVIA